MTAKVDAPLALTITRTFNAPAHVVFGIWADREHVMKWWGPKDFETIHVELDFRLGGAYRIGMKHPDGVGRSWMGGRFVEIIENERIVFTFKWDDANDSIGVETLITLTLEERDGKTTQIFHQAPFLNTDSRDSHSRGWNELFDNEQGYAECVAKGGHKS